MTTREHYEEFLAGHYTWMFGMPFDAKVAEQRRFLEESGALPAKRRLALDLGAGSGFQTMALADLGFDRVIAVDFSPRLLAELDSRKGTRAIETVEADLNDYLARFPHGAADAILCMGDTLTHLAGKEDVQRLLKAAASALSEGGVLVLTYRDLSAELAGTDRFIPVASDADRILTCFLEYAPDFVAVHDLLYERAGTAWQLRASTYRKLRLPIAWLEDALKDAGLAPVERRPAGRLSGLIAWKR